MPEVLVTSPAIGLGNSAINHFRPNNNAAVSLPNFSGIIIAPTLGTVKFTAKAEELDPLQVLGDYGPSSWFNGSVTYHPLFLRLEEVV